LEGYLFPSTYLFEANTAAKQVIETMTKEFDANIRPLFQNGFPQGFDEKAVLTMASIIEREAVFSSERPIIAAVYYNRLKKKMALAADPTVQYALGHWKKNVTLNDLKIDSPYNTYLHRGLPPGPICSPGIESVKAALNPPKLDVLFFVADGNGRHIFNNNYDEHLKAKSMTDKERRASLK
ncbi:MAG: endolytic transglycosylase MltG, partial [Elusimicrobia bacterium]|nr:endolytic transglycosylase MltG [Elusimicrobiota bacterium]